MNTTRQLKLMSEFWQLYVVQQGFRFWFVHPNPGEQPRLVHPARPTGDVWGGTADVHPLLLHLGWVPGVCCYEVGLYRPACSAEVSA